MRAKLYPYYSHRTDPVMERLCVIIRVNGGRKVVANKCKVSSGTLRNWDKRKTRRPQFATVCAVGRSLGDEGIQAIIDTIKKGK